MSYFKEYITIKASLNVKREKVQKEFNEYQSTIDVLKKHNELIPESIKIKYKQLKDDLDFINSQIAFILNEIEVTKANCKHENKEIVYAPRKRRILYYYCPTCNAHLNYYE
jgi:hypothetical protein